MQRLGNGYTKYFNEKYKRSGVLFQSKFKSVHVKSNEQLFYLSAYVNFNYLVHGLGHRMSKSSLWEYMKGDEKSEEKICHIKIISAQIPNSEKYQQMARETAQFIAEKRRDENVILE